MSGKIANRKGWRKISFWLAILVLIAAVGGYLFIQVYLSRSLPFTNGILEINGLEKEVIVQRDEYGVPHIQAKSEKDLYMAQGYIQAQDRMFQMDLSRRQASGRLSEVVGKSTVHRDKYFRTLGLRRAAEASYDEYSREGKQILQWYADGVNAYLKEAKAKKKLPVEFTLLGYQPKKWTVIDSLTIGKFMAFDLGGHWEGQAFRYWALEHLPKDKANDLLPSYPKDAPTILSDYGGVELEVENRFANIVIPPEFNGSNNWVVSGEKSQSGKPILADDPHLSLSTPSIWYQMHLQTNELNVSGVIFAGVPGIILGHNEHIAWGVTNTGPDVQDLYIEKRHPNSPNQFLYNGEWEKAKIIHESIQVKDEETIKLKVIETRHGPVLSDFLGDHKEDAVLSLKWTALEPTKELEAVIQMNKAKNWEQFEQALLEFHAPTQNFVFAAKDGTIAYKANGKIPIRKKGDGLLPVPGWTDEYEWTGYIPFDELPKIVNPKEGFISTANNKVINDDYPYHISHVWAQPYRQMRIQEVLKEKETFSIQDMKKLQMDTKNLYAKEFVPMMIKELQKNSLTNDEKQAIHLLEKWNYEDHKDSAAPLIFHLWMKEIPHVLFENEIPNEMLKLFEGKTQIVDELLRQALKGEHESTWFKDKGGVEKVLEKSLANVLSELQEEFGENMKEWKWGEYHQLYFEHPLSAGKYLIEKLFNPEKPNMVSGSQVTVQAASYRQNGIVHHGASWRFVIDTNKITEGYHIVGPGQSGHVKSAWYHDQIDDWIKGNYHQTTILPLETEHTLVLKPMK
ncbi:penicillin amidase [Oikeobacillus pervagus]|uniref:Penicillin amidase n=1 Tax=Oikeobacillus pervagus TaxID=1325931 RepID=A0AAJ1T0W6_9BACI|nr:penicillin acylase family protein [Oikeobacillus pervagus]MDQ0214691.1 penicillin amidase [Oikeobacillus pervagus]